MSRHPRRFQPGLESLEDRCTPSAVPGLQLPDAHALLPAGTSALIAGTPGAQPQVLYGNSAGHSDTRVVPFKITGGGPAPGLPIVPGESAGFGATGTATELGKYTSQNASFTLDTLNISPTGAVTGTFHGSIVFVAANGDHLAFTFGTSSPGQLTGTLSPDGKTLNNVTFVAPFTPDAQNSTGRFADVTGGSFTMTAHADSVLLPPNAMFSAPFTYTWSGEGTLEFSNGKK